jgi:CubicO group peptidase (beta-lactamase class C family)
MNKMLTLPVLILTACATMNPAARDIDRFARKVLSEISDAPSVGIAVVRDEKPFYAGGVGSDAYTGYYIGSTTKAYTGLACAILAQRGQLDLDTPISKYLPEVTTQQVTLRAFLTHTSGVENDAIAYRTAYTGEHTPEQLTALLNLSKSGKKEFAYTNTGYIVASLILERITGKPWQQVLDALVFTPLGMDHTSAYMSEAERWPMTSPYQIDRTGNLAPARIRKIDSTMHAAGGIVTTPADLARWLEANITNGRLEGRQVIPAAAFEEAHRQQVPAPHQGGPFVTRGYGFGWFQGDYHGNNILFHGGGYQGWQSRFSFMPEKKIGVGLMTNASGPSARVIEFLNLYIYDRLLETPNIDTVYAERLAKLKSDMAAAKAGYLAEIEKRSRRPWMLQHPNSAYVGRYENPMWGTIVIEEENSRLTASFAQLKGVLEAYTEPETARVELVPGSGEVLRFQIGSDGTAETLRFGDEVFRRVPQ